LIRPTARHLGVAGYGLVFASVCMLLALIVLLMTSTT